MQLPETIILTGATGFIGQHVARKINENPSCRVMSLKLRALEKGQASELCARDCDGNEAKLSSIRHGTLAHLAWCLPTRESVLPHAHQVGLLAELLNTHGDSFDRVIALGSAEEYGVCSGQLLETEAQNTGLSPYGWGKRAAQTLLDTWCNLTGKPGLWLRPFLVYGQGQQGNMAIPYAVRQALRREPAGFSAGTQRRDFIHVEDIARAIALAVETQWTGFNVANLGTGLGTPLREVLEKIAGLYGVADLFSYGVRPLRPGEPEVQIANTIQASNLIGFSTQITLDDGLARMQKASQN